MNLNDTFHVISTLIEICAPGVKEQGSAFFYNQLGTKDPLKEKQNVKVEATWLITNRHVVLPKINGKEVIPDSVTFYLRKSIDERYNWEPITISKAELLKRAKFHQNDKVDVCAIRVLDLLIEKIKDSEDYLQWGGISSEQHLGKNNIFPEASDDAIVIGYPRGFYDWENLYPIIKSGIIASKWGANFNGNPYFLIDAKLFPGSSGSIVVLKPTNLTTNKNGQLFFSEEKQFAFLGIYSGELFQEDKPFETDELTIILKKRFNLGIVWYGILIDEIIANGKSIEF
jgi:hypothetical protein